jgi:MscS family membrane protein
MTEEAVTCLKEVLDRIDLPPESEWPDESHVEEQGIQRWAIPHTEISIARVEEGPKKGQFLFSPDTVERAAEFYERVRHLPYQDRPTVTPDLIQFYQAEPGWMLPRRWIKSLPDWAHRRSAGQATWQWIGLSITLLVSLLLMATAYLIGMRKSRWSGSSGLIRYLMTLAFPVIAMVVPLVAHYFVKDQLRITGDLLVGLTYILDVAFLFALMMFVLGAGNRLSAVIIATPWVKPRGLDAQLVRLTCRVLGITAAVVVLLEGGRMIGIPLTTLLAGAGVSGLALALAAQDTLKNVFGSIMISLDKPYRVGERIVVKGYDGVVEEVGLRSTKIRMLTGHLTTIPNEEMARSDIENIGRRPHIRRITDIPIPLDSPPEKIERAVQIVREVLDDHEGMAPEFPPRVYFNDFNRDSFNIRLILWYHPPAYWDFLAFSQHMNQRIVEAFETDGIQFAPPTNVTYVAQTQDEPLRLNVEGHADEGDRANLSNSTQRKVT